MLRTKTVAIITQSFALQQIAASAFGSEGHETQFFDTLRAFLSEQANARFDAIILDVSARPPRDEASFAEVVRIVGSARVWLALPLGISPWAVDAERLGIRNFLRTPVQRTELEEIVEELSGIVFPPPAEPEFQALDVTRSYYLEEIANGRYFLAANPVMMNIYENVRLLAAVDAPVLILGESGVGKDVVANLLHKHSRRASHSFSSVNCAALPTELLESELFGYEAGAFTGAVKAKPGKFEMADKGTILLDEIGEMSAPMQAKLLHVLQDGRYSRLGARTASTADVRVVAATNIDIERAIAVKAFREDLYYRISTFTIHVPPLRERRDEIPFLVEEMIKRHAAQFQQEPVYISPRILSILQEYDWPGNLRELSNMVIRMQVLKGAESAIADIQAKVLGKAVVQRCPPEVSDDELSVHEMRSIVKNFKCQTESVLIQQALQAARWNRRQAALALRISYRTLLYKIDQYRLKESSIAARLDS